MTVLMITCGQPHSPNCPLHRKFYVNFILQNIDVTRNSANKKVGTSNSGLSDLFVSSQVDSQRTSQQLNTAVKLTELRANPGAAVGTGCLETQCTQRGGPKRWQTSAAVRQELNTVVGNLKVHYRVHNSTPLVPILSLTNPVYDLRSCFFKIYFNILPSTPTSSKWHVSFTFPHQYSVITSLLPHTCHMSSQSHLSWWPQK